MFIRQQLVNTTDSWMLDLNSEDDGRVRLAASQEGNMPVRKAVLRVGYSSRNSQPNSLVVGPKQLRWSL